MQDNDEDSDQDPQMTRQQYRKLQLLRERQSRIKRFSGDTGLKSRDSVYGDREARIQHLARKLDKLILILLLLIVVVYLILWFVNF